MKTYTEDKKLEKSVKEVIIKRSLAGLVILVMIISPFCVFVFLPKNLRESMSWVSDVFVFFFPFFLLIILLILLYISVAPQYFYKKFAKINDLKFTSSGWRTTVGILFNFGKSKKMTELMTGNINDYKFALYNYQFNYETVKISKTILEVELKNIAPKVLYTADRFLVEHLVDNYFKNISKIDLDGNIKENYCLYSEKDFEIEVLQLFSPELLLKLRDEYDGFTIDINNKRMIMYAEGVIVEKVRIYKLYELGEYLINELAPIIRKIEVDVKNLEGLKNKKT